MFVLFYIIVAVLIWHGLISFPKELFGYFKNKTTQDKDKRLFPIGSVIIYIILTLVFFWYIFPQFSRVFSDIRSYLSPYHPTLFYCSISDFLCNIWYVGFIPILLLLFYEIGTKGDRKVKVLIYAFIKFLCVINILLGGWALWLPMIPLPLKPL